MSVPAHWLKLLPRQKPQVPVRGPRLSPREGRDVGNVDVTVEEGRDCPPPLSLPVDHTAFTVAGLRHTFAEQARHLRDDLSHALDKALQPLKDDIAALPSWLGHTSSFLERAEELVSRLDIASSVLPRAPLHCSPMEGSLPHVAVGLPSATAGPAVVQGLVPLHEGDEASNKGTPTAADASPTFTSITPSSSPPSLVESQCLLHLSLRGA